MADFRMECSVEGLDPILGKIEELARLTDRRGVRRALKQGAGVLTKEGRVMLQSRLMPQGAKWRTGNLLRSMTYKNAGRRGGAMTALSGFRRGQGAGAEADISANPRQARTGNHAHLVDLGTGERFTRKGKYRGRMPANFFWTTTKNQFGGKALQAVEEGLEEEALRVMR